MKVALVSEHASPLAALGGVDAGGQNVHVASLADGLANLGADVTVHTRRESPALPRRVAMRQGVVVDHVDAGPAAPIPKDDLFPFMDAFAEQLRQQWSLERPAVVHAHFWMSGYASLAAGLPLGIPVIQTYHALGIVKRRHQGPKDTSPAQRLDVEATIARSSDQIVATCTDEVFELIRLGARAGRISIVPCGVDVDRFQPTGEAEPRRHGLRRLVVVSRLVERKGIGTVIAALPSVPGTELVIAGGPRIEELHRDPEACRLMELSRRLGVAHRVRFRGRMDHDRLPALLRSADAVVCVPWYEPFGIVPLEAMACGTPVIASAVGGLVDTVVDGVTGVHVPPRHPVALAAAARRLLADPAAARALGAAGVTRARRRFSWQRVSSSTLEIYQQVSRGSALLPASRRQ